MDKATVINAVKTLIGKAKIEDAISSLSTFFEQEAGRYDSFNNRLLAVQSHYSGIRNKENRALISHEEAQRATNQVADQLIRLLEDLGKEKPDRGENTDLKKNKQKLFAVIGLLSLAVMATAIWRFGLSQESGREPQALIANPNKIPIQEFESDALFKILIMPFKPDLGALTTVHKNIQLRMGILADKQRIKIDSKIYPLDPSSEAYPLQSIQAEKLVKNWNADLVIWGNTYKEENQNTTLTRYKFLKQNEYFKFHKLSLNDTDGTLVDTLTTVSAIATDGILTEDIEAILLGIVAFMKKDYKDAVAFLEEANVNDSLSVLLKNMFLAEIHIMEGDLDKAIEAYDEVIKTHPDYALAHNNRGMIYFDQGQPGPALVDFDATLAINQNDENVLLSRGKAYEKLGLWQEAREDYTSVIQAKSGALQKNIKERISNVEMHRKEEENKLNMAKEKLRKSPKDTTALREIVDAAIKVGNYEEATSGAAKLLEIDPMSIPAYINKIKLQITNKKPEEALKIFNDARAQGLDSAELVKAVPMLKGLLPTRRKE
ncbi:MAG: tetratricopeptide repeat protein [Saprospiraceae bacterium]|nr:tetratricopeptide repeat protein [Saprospiraceae bacterium]